MTTTARQTTARLAGATVLLAALVIAALIEQYDECDLCPRRVTERFTRIDNRDGAEVDVCEHCADHGDVSHIAG